MSLEGGGVIDVDRDMGVTHTWRLAELTLLAWGLLLLLTALVVLINLLVLGRGWAFINLLALWGKVNGSIILHYSILVSIW